MNPNERRNEIEAWWALIARILGFFLGALIIVYQTFYEPSDRWLLLLIAATLMGPMIVSGLAQLLTAARGNGTRPPPGEDQP